MEGAHESLQKTLRRYGVDPWGSARTQVLPPNANTVTADFEDTVKHLPRVSIGTRGTEDYVIEGKLGEGGMAEVLLAVQASMRRHVALKRLSESSEENQALLLREAIVAGQLEHPNIVPTHALVRGDQGPMVVLKKVTGVSWEDLLYRGHASLERHLEIWTQVCNAVAFAHSRAVMHLDIKPSNVMIGEFGEVYLVDWGLARRIGEPVLDGPFGTPSYLPPEMAQGQFSQQSDIFLLGATLHEALVGAPLYTGASVLEAIGQAIACEPYSYGDKLPQELTQICLRACSRDPAARHRTVHELQQALETYRKHRESRGLASSGRRAGARLSRLLKQAGTSPSVYPEAQALFGEARFAFEQAIAAWPQSPLAHEGLRQILVLMAEYELLLDHPEAALSLVSSVEGLPAELVGRVHEVNSRTRNARERLSTLEQENDLQVGGAWRRRVFRTVGGAMFTLTAILAASRVRGVAEVPSTHRLALVGTVVASLVVGAAFWWRSRGWNQANQRIALTVVAALLCSGLQRWLAVLTGASAVHVLVNDAVLVALAGIYVGLLHRAGMAFASVAILVAVFGALLPALVDDMFIFLTLAISAVAVVVIRRERDSARLADRRT